MDPDPVAAEGVEGEEVVLQPEPHHLGREGEEEGVVEAEEEVVGVPRKTA